MICYFTTIWTHYQHAIGRELASVYGSDQFKLVLVRPMEQRVKLGDEGQRKMGWALRPPAEPWIVPPPENEEELFHGVWVDLMRNSDVVVVGSLHGRDNNLTRAVGERLRNGKLTFFFEERLFKKALKFRDYCNPIRWLGWVRQSLYYRHANAHYLPTAYDAPKDMRFIHAFKGRMWSWAYFPEVSPAPVNKVKNDSLRICWCGRMLYCKRVDFIIKALAKLPPTMLNNCRITIVGEGEARDSVLGLAHDLGVYDHISFKPLMTLPEVISLMTDSDVYIFPSNREEGWGLALEEAMDRCCVPIANREAGVTMKVVEDGVNGFVFNDGDVDCIAEKIKWLYHNPAMRHEMGVRAWRKIQSMSPAEGAKRFACLLKAIQTGDYSRVPKEGLCSNVG